MASKENASSSSATFEDVARPIIASPASSQTDKSISTIIDAISSPEISIRAKAFSVLALLLQNQSQPKTYLVGPIESFLQSTDVDKVCRALAGLSVIFQISPNIGLDILKLDGFLARMADSTMDLLDIASKNSSTKSDLKFSLADFLALAMNQKPAREAVRIDWPGCVDWLSRLALATTLNVSVPARCAASLALIKLRLTSENAESMQEIPSLNRLAEILIKALLDKNSEQLNNVIEGLALASQKPVIRQKLMDQPKSFLLALKVILQAKKYDKIDSIGFVDTSTAYGIVTILLNVSTYKPLRSEEDEATERLRKLASRGNNGNQSKKIAEVDEDEHPAIEDEKVVDWLQGALNHSNDLMEIVGSLVKIESKEVRRTTGKVLLNLVDRQQFRGKVLQAGGGRMLMKIIATLTIPSSTSENVAGSSDSESKNQRPVLETVDLPSIQALSKILITTNPLLIFGPSPESPLLLSTVRPVTALFVHPSATLLQTFESLMALTNLASLGPRIAAEVASSPRVLIRLEECMVGIRTGENEMIRRAATELTCNLSTTESVISGFNPRKPSKNKDSSFQVGDPSNTRLHLLIALSSSEDLQTSLAASGSLATLTQNSSEISNSLNFRQSLAESLSRVSIDIIEEGKVGVQLRVITVLGNLISEMDSNRLEGFVFKNGELIKSIKGLIEKLGDEDVQSKEVKRLTKILIEEIEKRIKIVEVE